MILGLGATATQAATGTTAQAAFLKAWKMHAPGFTAGEFAGLLQSTADYGKKVNDARPFQLFPDYDPAPLKRAIAAAEASASAWRDRMPWIGEGDYYAKTGPEAAAVQKAITAVYMEAAGITGASATVAAAKQELVKNLTVPSQWAWLQKAKPYLIVGGVLVAGAIAYPYVKPLLKRAG